MPEYGFFVTHFSLILSLNMVKYGSKKTYILTYFTQRILKINWMSMFVCLIVFTSKTADQTHEIERKLLKLIPSTAIRNSRKPVLYYNNCFAIHRPVLSGDIEINFGLAEANDHHIKSKYNRLPSLTCEICNTIIKIKLKRLLSIHYKMLIYLQFSELKFTRTRNSSSSTLSM